MFHLFMLHQRIFSSPFHMDGPSSRHVKNPSVFQKYYYQLYQMDILWYVDRQYRIITYIRIYIMYHTS